MTPPKHLSLTANGLVDCRAVDISGAHNRRNTFALLKLAVQIGVLRAFPFERFLTGSFC
ncbi:hypothetical protein [Deinococcus sp.]|uniref:hypothetical protein n=1 Tax=Deinococcus sp. TaxID=47478 RepID=UPI00286DDB20|nr:hypothetical protein [Deinococcus sp.]